MAFIMPMTPAHKLKNWHFGPAGASMKITSSPNKGVPLTGGFYH